MGDRALGLVGLVVGATRSNQTRQDPAGRLLSGGSLVSGMRGAMFASTSAWPATSSWSGTPSQEARRPTPGFGRGVWALVWRDLQRVIRFPKPFVGLVAAMIVPYAVDALGLSMVTAFLSPLALVAALIPFLGSMRVLSRTNGLARTLPFSNAQIRTALMVIPALLALVWFAAALPAVVGIAGGPQRDPAEAIPMTLLMAAAGLLGAVRWQVAKPVDFATPMVATASGAVPPVLLFNLFRGIDIVAVVAAPMLLGMSMVWPAVIALVVFFVLRSGTSLAEMQEQADEQRRVLEEEKKKQVQKTTLPRPRR